MQRNHSLGKALAAIALTATACGGSSGSTAADPASTAEAGPAAYKVLVDGHTADNQAAFIAFFPKVLQVHPGDSITFHSAYSGEPHTVAMGAVVNAALDKMDALQKSNPKALEEGPPPPEFAKIPQLLPEGPGDAIAAGAEPCVVAAGGVVPTKDACPVQSTPAFEGTEQLASSGWLGVDQDWTVTMGKNIAPGRYRIMCQLHGPSMTAEVEVVAPGTQIKDPAAVEAEGAAERDALLTKLQPAFAAVEKATDTKAAAGGLVPDVESAFVTAFGPKEIAIPVGGTVSWDVRGPHSIAFNAPADGQELRQPGAGTSVHLSSKAFLAAGGPGADPSEEKTPPVIKGGTWNGQGFRSSGVIFGSGPPNPTAFTLTFSKAGTYNFLCTVHTDMKGRIKVG